MKMNLSLGRIKRGLILYNRIVGRTFTAGICDQEECNREQKCEHGYITNWKVYDVTIDECGNFDIFVQCKETHNIRRESFGQIKESYSIDKVIEVLRQYCGGEKIRK